MPMNPVSHFHNLPTVILRNDVLELECLSTAGPRIVRLRYKGGENLFAEVPDTIQATPFGEFHFYGGHRLWHAPEVMPRTYFPENSGVTCQSIPGGLRINGPHDLASNIHKAITIQMDLNEAKVNITHELLNENPWEVRLAPWAITMFKLGGTAVLPARTGTNDSSGLLPDRRIVFWPYTNINDPRVSYTDETIVINAVPDVPFKIATFNPCGWMTYTNNGVVFKKTFHVDLDGEYPDLGSNAEIYCNTEFIELESLGPIATLPPGTTISWEEDWEVYPE